MKILIKDSKQQEFNLEFDFHIEVISDKFLILTGSHKSSEEFVPLLEVLRNVNYPISIQFDNYKIASFRRYKYQQKFDKDKTVLYFKYITEEE